MGKLIGVGLYGDNGHQIHGQLVTSPNGRLVAAASVPDDKLPDPEVRRYATLEEMLGDDEVELVSLCSPRRADQVEDALRCLRAGRHVYAEKPAALANDELDRILEMARACDREFHEMSETIFAQPWYRLREMVREGTLGEIVQVFAQKSYPGAWDWRPQDESVDGGLTRQCAIHAARFVVQVAGLRVTSVQAAESKLGNPKAGELRTATSFLLKLANGGVGTIVANYLNPSGFLRRGNDQVRLFGTRGMAEITDDGLRSRWYVEGKDCGPIMPEGAPPETSYLEHYLAHLRDGSPMPFDLEEEFHPLRVVNDAKLSARLAD